MIPITDSGKAAPVVGELSTFGFTRMAVFCLLAVYALLLMPTALRAEVPRALPPGELPNDRRLEPLKDLDGYFPFYPSASADEWARRAEEVRQQMRVALGLWPAPTKTPLNVVIHGRIDRPDYTVEKVYFESVPGFFVTGNLYRPKGKTGPVPGVLCPHGHWDDGRFLDYGPKRVLQEIVQGAERFEEGGRSVLQSRCVQLARMGCVVFHYDMIGYADSLQIPMEISHRFDRQRSAMNSTEDWGFFSPQAEAHLQSIMGLQTWDSIRALDFLLTLPEVDPQRIAVTGASGGGTQTFVLCALDPRPAVAFPAVMVSTAMQGGCTCENASLLRVDTGNVEFAALFAPKPLGMTAANDWTKEMPTKGFPELKKHYAMLGAPENVMLKPLVHFEHNYNYVSRAAMYSWLNKQLKLGLPEPIVEEDYTRLTKDQMSVWDEKHPEPEGGPAFERRLLHWLWSDAQKQLSAAGDSLDSYRQMIGKAVDVLIGRKLDQVGQVVWVPKAKEDRGAHVQMTGLLRNIDHAEELPAVVLEPKQRKNQTVIWTDRSGKAGLFGAEAVPQLKPEIQKLLDAGVTVVGVDLLYQGEFLKDGQPLTQTPRVKNPREAAAYTFGYNRAVFAQRVHDILSVVIWARSKDGKADQVDLVGLDETGALAAAARAQAGDAVARAAINTHGFRFGQMLDFRDPNFLPGGAKYGDLPGLIALGAPGRLWLAGEGDEAPEIVKSIYGKASAADRLAINHGENSPAAAVAWLLEK